MLIHQFFIGYDMIIINLIYKQRPQITK